ncbi:MAG: FAD-dependent oxidoreductase [Lachnospiraceae bacterium]|nr:FAD-dependent oxidoreductase [Lachnospiraceae bacterium]
MYEAIVIGSGPAGLSAALYLKRAGKKVILIEKEYEGTGQIARSICVDNYLGFRNISGEELGDQFRQHVLEEQVEILEDEVTKLVGDEYWIVKLESGNQLETKTLIYATGAEPRQLSVPGEQQYLGRGVSYCAYCDGSLYKGKDVAVVGGGDTALDDALYLSDLCNKVYLIHRREEFRGNAAVLDSIRSRENIELLLNTMVSEVKGDKKTEAILLHDGRSISVNGMFVAIGSKPATELIKSYVSVDENGYVLAGEDGITSAPGLFVAGDLRAKALRQVVTAVSDGANAAVSAIQYLKTDKRG